MYSRRLRVEEKRDRKTAFLYIVLSIVVFLLLFTYGLPNAVKLIGFVGEFKNASKTTESEDKTPPPVPAFENLPKATKESSLEIAGSTEAGVTVILEVNGKINEVLANNDGRFLFQIFLAEGENLISAKSKDRSGNVSVQTATEQIIFDDIPPELEVTTPSDGSNYYGAKQRQTVVSGKTGEASKVQINDRRVIINSDGSFSYSYPLSDGENSLAVTSEDEAGNKTEVIIKVTYTP